MFLDDNKTIWHNSGSCLSLQSVQVDPLESSDIYETVRSEVRRAIFEIQNDLESVSSMADFSF